MKMKILVFLTAMAMIVPSLVFCNAMTEDVKGPMPDTVIFNVRMQRDIGIKDTAEGMTNLFYEDVSNLIVGLDPATLNKLDIYRSPAIYLSLIFNPCPNEQPYLVKVDGKEYFNPFAISEVRFSMNDLINRKYIVDEVLRGAGGPMLSMAIPALPGTTVFTETATSLGITEEGDEEKALKVIEEELTKASSLPALKRRLIRGEKWWTFDKQPVTIKFMIRVDDPEVRLREGRYIADQIEKAGIKVDRCEWDRFKCLETLYNTDPADLAWSIYTEGWINSATDAFHDSSVYQMHATLSSDMPGWNNPQYWSYKNPTIDEAAEKIVSGDLLTADEYWDCIRTSTELGLKDSVRIGIAYQDGAWVANRERFNQRMYYGLGDGINKYSLVTADTKDKMLKVTQYSSQGSLFMGTWDPIGSEGLSDVYSTNVFNPLTDSWMVYNPATGIKESCRVQVDPDKDVETLYHRENGALVGEIPVPENAINYDPVSEQWVAVGPDVTAIAKVTGRSLYSNWHDGHPITMADILENYAFTMEWVCQDPEDDLYYDESYAAGPRCLAIKKVKGTVINSDGSMTLYIDQSFPQSKALTADGGAQWMWVGGTGSRENMNSAIPWQLKEALAKLVAEGSASGTIYSFTRGAATEPDMLNPECVKDIRAKLVEMRDTGYIPSSIKDYTTWDEAEAGYDAVIKWIDDHGHFAISCGPFYLDSWDPLAASAVLRAFRDPTYPFTPDYWPKRWATSTPGIDKIDVPMICTKATGIPVKVRLSKVDYPEGTSRPAKEGNVIVSLATPTGEITYNAVYKKPGLFEVVIPAEELEPGSYIVMVTATIPGGAMSTTTSTRIYLR
jgi:peptide/nickel transport system substrate-binding protein